MKEHIENWTKEEYKTFIMLHLAHADLKITNNELFEILQTVDETSFKKIEMIWSNSNDAECFQIIKDQFKKHYPESEGKQELINEITQLANADNKFSVYEQNLIRSLKKVL